MQMRIIALAVFGLMSSAAFAESTVKIGGKYDAGYQFKHTANADKNGLYDGATTTETLGDGGSSTSRITVQAKEDLMPGWDAMVDLDLRFGTVEEGKTGISSNDKKALYLTSPYGNLRWGVMNLVSQQYWDYEEKPYMVNVKDLEIVKYGIMAKRVSSLTSRATEYDTPVFNLGPVAFRAKANYVFGDNRKAGANNNDSAAAAASTAATAAANAKTGTVGGPTYGGDVYAVAFTGAVGKLVNWTISTHHRQSTANIDGTAASGKGTAAIAAVEGRDGMHWQEHSISIHPIEGLKIGVNYNIYKGRDGLGGDFKEKNTNFVVAYNFGDRFQVGVERSHLNDLASTRNSGKGWMVGGSYFLSKSAYVYAAWQKDDFQRNEKSIAGGYNGTGTGFMGSFDKVDGTYTRLGFVKEF